MKAEYIVIGVIVLLIIAYIVAIVGMMMSKSLVFRVRERPPLAGGVPLNTPPQQMSSQDRAKVGEALAKLKGNKQAST
jgi:hypothetical protein